MTVTSRWEHFPHEADVGVRGLRDAGAGLRAGGEDDCGQYRPGDGSAKPGQIIVAHDAELLLVEWLNMLVFEMATHKMLFSRFEVQLQDLHLTARIWGEAIDVSRHHPATEVKGATYTELKVAQQPDGSWFAQCVVDV
jgi:tRNA nucleotidyltransferase (CCA-adding enzyme)